MVVGQISPVLRGGQKHGSQAILPCGEVVQLGVGDAHRGGIHRLLWDRFWQSCLMAELASHGKNLLWSHGRIRMQCGFYLAEL